MSRLLRLILDRGFEPRGYLGMVDLPRDLHTVLEGLVDLETLAIYRARVPSTVLDGLAGGALLNLRTLLLHRCGVSLLQSSSLTNLYTHFVSCKTWNLVQT